MKKFNFISILFTLIIFESNLKAQNDSIKKNEPVFKNGLQFKLNESGSNYVQFKFVSQMWVMYNANNPGSSYNGQPISNSVEVGLRRDRFLILSQVSDHVFVFSQFALDGFNSLTALKPQWTLYDMTLEYKFDRYLTLGGGLNGWDGPSRFSNPSVPTILGLDQPLYQQATSNITDQAVRMPGVYAKGKLSKLEYRLSVGVPLSTTATSTGTAITQTSTVAKAAENPQWAASEFAANPYSLQYQGYFMYQFLDEESNLTPGTVGTYLGEKKVFNIGAGFRYQHNAMWHGDYKSDGTNLTISDTSRTDMMLWAIDVFYDVPVNKEKGTAVSLYAAYSHYGFGQNYIRNSNPLNPVNGIMANNTNKYNPDLASFNGSGNQFPMIGTGNIYYIQGGYLLSKFKNGTQFQPYGQFMYANYEALKDPVILWDLGINYFIKGYNAKFSLDYQSRPVFNISSSDNQIHNITTARKGCVILQYQIAF